MSGAHDDLPLILVVDDDPHALRAMLDLLEAPDRRVVGAASGEEALRRLLHDEAAVVLLDVRMRGLDGLATAALIRGRERTRETPIIFVTGLPPDARQIEAVYAAGAVDIVFKPVPPPVVRQKVDVFVELRRRRLEQARLTEALARSERNLRVALDCADGLMVVDGEGRVRYRNPAAETLLPPSEEDPASAPVPAIGRRDVEVLGCGPRRVIELNTVQIDWDGAQAYLSTIRDVTYRAQAEEELRARGSELETLFRVVCHDLRTPLRHVRALIDMLGEDLAGGDEEATREDLSRLDGAAARLQRLLDDLTLLARARSAAATPATCSGPALAERVLADLELAIRETDARVRVGPLPPVLPVGSVWAALVLENLLQNALKFTRPGAAPDVEVDAYAAAAAGEVGLVVRDRGPGVPPAQAQRIFELYRRAASADVPGAGVGLAIVDQVARRHGGRAWVSAREGGGSEFVVTFAFREVPAVEPSTSVPLLGRAGHG